MPEQEQPQKAAPPVKEQQQTLPQEQLLEVPEMEQLQKAALAEQELQQTLQQEQLQMKQPEM